MADQKFRGVAVCVDVIGGDDRRPSDPIMVFGVQEMILTRTFLDSGCCFAQDERLSSASGGNQLRNATTLFRRLAAALLFVRAFLVLDSSLYVPFPGWRTHSFTFPFFFSVLVLASRQAYRLPFLFQ